MRNSRKPISILNRPSILLIGIAMYFVTILGLPVFTYGSANDQDGIWTSLDNEQLDQPGIDGRALPGTYKAFQLNRDALKAVLGQAPEEFTSGTEVILRLPMPDGTLSRFRIEHSLVVELDLVNKFPELGATYRGYGIDDPTATVRFDLLPNGFHAMTLSVSGTAYVDPWGKGDRDIYIAYDKRDRPPLGRFECDTKDRDDEFSSQIEPKGFSPDAALPPLAAPAVASGTQLRTYRLAVAATHEYAVAVGGDTIAGTLAAQVVVMNRVNGVYEREVAVHMNIIGTNNLIVYANDQLCGGVACTDANDPYSNGSGSTMLGENQANIDAVIGTANYDIGHVFSTGGGGVANGAGPCNAANKARGVTGQGVPLGDPFAIDYVAHEMGHQFTAQHTWNAVGIGSCSPGQYVAGSAFEPGSGITIMGYAGICGNQDLARNSIDIFQLKSLEEIINYTQVGGGNVCAVTTATGNTPPTVTGPGNFDIPKQTPFLLTASASDPDPDTITYEWEEYDLGASTLGVPNSDATGARPIFRSYLPTASGTRYFPSLVYILNNANVPPSSYDCGRGAGNPCLTGELLPSISRTMTFRVIARDNRANGGGINTADSIVTVDGGSGPFVVTSPNTGVTLTGGSSPTVTWNVANTTNAPVNAANVDIALSTDGGNSFPTALASGVANNGSRSVTLPSISTTTARIRVRGSGNIFFDVSDTNFTIVMPTATTITSSVNPSVFGQPVTFTASVATVPPGGTPTGTVSFSDNAAPIAGCQNVALNGSAQAACAISNLSVGNHTITGDYTPGVGFAASSGSMTGNPQVVNKADTTTALGSSVNPSVFGQSVTFTATISVTPPGAGTPTGTITFKDNAIDIGTCAAQPVAANVATCSISTLSVGTHPITAVYNGDGNFYTSTAGTVNQVVNKADTTTALGSSVNPSVFGQSVTFTATISVTLPGAGTPTGTVTFKDNGVNIGTCAAQPVAANVASCSISTFSVGSHPITAVYNGDGSLNASTSNVVNQVVNKADTTTTVTASPVSPSIFGQSVTFTATVAVVPPGAGSPTGTVSFNIDGNIYCANTPLVGLTATCTQAGLPALPAGVRNVVAVYSGDTCFNFSAGTLNYTVNKANTTTVIVNDTPDPSLVNQPYTVTWTVTAVAPGAGTPTGTVTVNGGTGGGTCTAAVAAGGCQLTPTTIGVKTISATYNGDNNFNTSTSSTTTHTVNVQITGTVRNGLTLAPVSGVTMNLIGCTSGSGTTTTNASGVYSFTGQIVGPCRVYPNPVSEPYERVYATVLANITNADFLIYANPADHPRRVTYPTQFVVPGAAGSMPVIMNSLGNEATVAFSFTYDINPFSQPPVVVCGANAPGCTITQNNTVFGKVGVTIAPVGGAFTRPDGTPLDEAEAAGPNEIARINFQTVASTTLPSTDFVLGNTPTTVALTETGTGNPLYANFIEPARIVFAHGIEADVAGRNAGSGAVDASDVTQVKRFVTGLDTPVGTHNEFQRADTAPVSTKGNGQLDATDVIQTRRFASGLDGAQSAGGPGLAAPVMAPEAERPESGAKEDGETKADGRQREISLGNAQASTNSRVSIPVSLRAGGDEMAVSFTVRYDETRLTNPQVALTANAAEGTNLTFNAEEPGVIRVLIDAASPVAATSAREAIELLSITFDVTQTAPTGETELTIEDGTISDARANALTARYTAGTISISGPNPTDEGSKQARRARTQRPEEFDIIQEWTRANPVMILRRREP